MPFSATVFRVLIASPGDALPERDAIERAIIEWDDEHAQDRGVAFLPVRWERASPRGGTSGQEVVNEDLVETSDVLIGVFWSRIGRKTKHDQSGSIEEIRQFATSQKPYGLFFKNQTLPMDHDQRQFNALKRFKAEVHSFDSELRGLAQDFESSDQLGRLVGRFLTDTLRRLHDGVDAEEGNSPRAGTGPVQRRISRNAESILQAAARTAVAVDDPRGVAIAKADDPLLNSMSDAAFQSALDELTRRDLLAITGDRGPAGLLIDIPHEGLDRGLRLARQTSEHVESRVRAAICSESPTTIEAVAANLGLAPLVVRHITEGYASQRLLSVERFADETRIGKPSSELCEWDRIRPRKACVVIGPHFPNSGDRLGQSFTVEFLNEGEHDARDIKAVFDTKGDGFPPEPATFLPFVLPAMTTEPRDRYQTGFSVPWPEPGEDGEFKPDQEKIVRLKVTFRDGLDERDEAQFTLRLRNVPNRKRWTAEEVRGRAPHPDLPGFTHGVALTMRNASRFSMPIAPRTSCGSCTISQQRVVRDRETMPWQECDSGFSLESARSYWVRTPPRSPCHSLIRRCATACFLRRLKLPSCSQSPNMV